MGDSEVLTALEAAKAEIRELQAENVNLKLKVDVEKQRVAALEDSLEEQRRATTSMLLEVEQEEEKITNALLKKIDQLQRERAQILRTVEEEEEYITNTLNKKLAEVRREKAEMEKALEQEQELIVSKLSAELERRQTQTKQLEVQLEQMRKEKIDLENTLECEQEALVNRLQKRLEELELERMQLRRQLSQSPHVQHAHDVENEEVLKLRALLKENEEKQLERERAYRADQDKLKDENLHLKQRVAFELERCKELERDLTNLERDMEYEEEKQFNLLTSAHSGHSTPPLMLRSISSTSSPRSSMSLGRVSSLENDVPLGTKWWTKRSEPHSHHQGRKSIDNGDFRRRSADGTTSAGRLMSADSSLREGQKYLTASSSQDSGKPTYLRP